MDQVLFFKQMAGITHKPLQSIASLNLGKKERVSSVFRDSAICTLNKQALDKIPVENLPLLSEFIAAYGGHDVYHPIWQAKSKGWGYEKYAKNRIRNWYKRTTGRTLNTSFKQEVLLLSEKDFTIEEFKNIEGKIWETLVYNKDYNSTLGKIYKTLTQNNFRTLYNFLMTKTTSFKHFHEYLYSKRHTHGLDGKYDYMYHLIHFILKQETNFNEIIKDFIRGLHYLLEGQEKQLKLTI